LVIITEKGGTNSAYSPEYQKKYGINKICGMIARGNIGAIFQRSRDEEAIESETFEGKKRKKDKKSILCSQHVSLSLGWARLFNVVVVVADGWIM
jgi:hypothetical protein